MTEYIIQVDDDIFFFQLFYDHADNAAVGGSYVPEPKGHLLKFKEPEVGNEGGEGAGFLFNRDGVIRLNGIQR